MDEKHKSLARIDDPLGPILAGGGEATLKFVLGMVPVVGQTAEMVYFGPKEALQKKRVLEAISELQEAVQKQSKNPFDELLGFKISDPLKYESACAALEQIYDEIRDERDINKRKLLVAHLKNSVIGISWIEVDILQEYTEILSHLTVKDIEVFKYVMSRMGKQDSRNMTVDAASSNIPGISPNRVLISLNKLHRFGLIDFATQGRMTGYGVSGALSEGIARYNGYGVKFFEYLTQKL